jgi:pyridoxamine 5'-phosphate oxidase
MTRAPIPPTPSDEAYRAEEDQGDVFSRDDPVALFEEWFSLACAREPDANAMALATASADGEPDVRMVLMKGVDQSGVTFFTHRTSPKGRDLAANPKAALAFYWKSIRRQVRFRGTIAEVSAGEADAYFAERARNAQLGAWFSRQSETLESREALERAMAETEPRFAGRDVPRPPHWTGYRLTPLAVEFWASRAYRLHDRLLFERGSAKDRWTSRRLWP